MTAMQFISTGLAATFTIYYGQTFVRRNEFRALGFGHIMLTVALILWAVASWVNGL